MKIAIDLMGGDNAPLTNQNAVVAFLKENENNKIVAFGPKEALQFPDFKQFDKNQLELVETTEIIKMDEELTTAVRMKNSSMFRAIKAVEDKEADAIVSAGGTGPLFAISNLRIKRIKGIKRAAIAGTFPTINNNPTLVLDLGGNADSTANYLNQFAWLGSEFAKILLNKEEVTVGLLNIGKEAKKGNELLKETFTLLTENKQINFQGNFEPNEVLANNVDVIVTDGYGGNILLKSTEGALKGFQKILESELKNNGIIPLFGAALSKKAFKGVKNVFSGDNYGGAVILGLNAPAIKAKGSSEKEQILFSLNLAKKMIENQFVTKLKNKLENGQEGMRNE